MNQNLHSFWARCVRFPAVCSWLTLFCAPSEDESRYLYEIGRWKWIVFAYHNYVAIRGQIHIRTDDQRHFHVEWSPSPFRKMQQKTCQPSPVSSFSVFYFSFGVTENYIESDCCGCSRMPVHRVCPVLDFSIRCWLNLPFFEQCDNVHLSRVVGWSSHKNSSVQAIKMHANQNAYPWVECTCCVGTISINICVIFVKKNVYKIIFPWNMSPDYTASSLKSLPNVCFERFAKISNFYSNFGPTWEECTNFWKKNNKTLECYISSI